MKDLIDKLEKATGADGDLDFEISKAISGQHIVQYSGAHLHYTSSVDDALMLVPEGYAWTIYTLRTGLAEPFKYFASVSFPNEGCGSPADATTPAIAVCIAALKARQAIAESK